MQTTYAVTKHYNDDKTASHTIYYTAGDAAAALAMALEDHRRNTVDEEGPGFFDDYPGHPRCSYTVTPCE